jgi:hypothetical protein
MRLIVSIPLIIFQILFLSPVGLANNQIGEFGHHHLLFKKSDSQKSIPISLAEQEVEDTDDSENEKGKHSRLIVFSDFNFSFNGIFLQSFRSGLSKGINSLNLRDLGLNLFQLHHNMRL